MLDTAFYLVLNMSIAGSIIGVFLLLLRRVKQIPSLSIYILWSFVFVRFIVPFALLSEVSIFKLTRGLVKRVVEVQGPMQGMQGNVKLTMSNMIGTANSYFPVTYKSQSIEALFKGLSTIWVIGVSFILLILCVFYYFSSKELRKAAWLKENIYTSRTVPSPIVYGILKQKIIIPIKLSENKLELKYILLHESIHIKRHDNLYRLLALLITCIHFFNPLAWFYLGLFYKDIERACDRKAVSALPPAERKKYAETLLNSSAQKNVFLATAFGNKDIKFRVVNVLSYKKITNFALILSTLFVFAIAVILLTNPQ